MVLFSREIVSVLIAKTAITVIVVTCLAFSLGKNEAIAAGIGGLISMANLLYYNFRVLRTTHADTDLVYIRGLLLTQLSKYFFSIVFIFIALGVFKLAVVPLLGTFMISQIAYFFVATKRRD